MCSKNYDIFGWVNNSCKITMNDTISYVLCISVHFRILIKQETEEMLSDLWDRKWKKKNCDNFCYCRTHIYSYKFQHYNYVLIINSQSATSFDTKYALRFVPLCIRQL